MKAGGIKRFVLDASVTVTWCFPEESTPFTEGLLDLLASGVGALTTAIWSFEVANALLMAERRKGISVAQVTTMLQQISTLPITIEGTRPATAFSQILAVARQEQLTEYDAAYLELAMREGLPLATLDKALRHAASNVGVHLVTI